MYALNCIYVFMYSLLFSPSLYALTHMCCHDKCMMSNKINQSISLSLSLSQAWAWHIDFSAVFSLLICLLRLLRLPLGHVLAWRFAFLVVCFPQTCFVGGLALTIAKWKVICFFFFSFSFSFPKQYFTRKLGLTAIRFKKVMCK